MTFSFWSLDFIYYPVSGIMWVWHKVFGFLFGVFGAESPYSNAWTWVLSVMFLVFTLRIIMFKPFMKQMDASYKMQKIQPEMKRIREKYKDDRQRLTEEMMKLNKEAGVSPLSSCLPALLQAPAFIGLFHVLRNFIIAFGGGPGVTAGDPINNYFFPASDVLNFHDALLFGGASLSAHLTMTDQELSALQSNRETMLWVGIPLMILAAVATHLSSRKSIARQKDMGTAQTGGQMAIMQKLMLYVFPLGVLFIGAFYPLALLFYWLANNFWTFGQLAIAHRIQDKKLDAAASVVEAEKDAASFSKPAPGARPQRAPKGGPRGPIAPVGRVDEAKRAQAAKERSEAAAKADAGDRDTAQGNGSRSSSPAGSGGAGATGAGATGGGSAGGGKGASGGSTKSTPKQGSKPGPKKNKKKR